MMEKHAVLNPGQSGELPHDGTYGNPVAVLYNEDVAYEITAVNANLTAGNVVITDTLPPYMELVPGSYANASTATVPGSPQRAAIRWEIQGVPSLDTRKVGYRATPEQGAVASQPFFVNRAWVQTSDTIFAYTNSTYHQGAGVAVVTFSAAAGGSIFNADLQALDYRTSPREGILVVPDSGYVFAGWSHEDYISLRGERIPADSGVMRIEDLVIYGNVELRASFVPGVADPGNLPGAAEKKKGDEVWAHASTLYVRTVKGVTVRVYTPDGVLRRLFTTIADGVTTRRLNTPGIYFVTLNGNAAWKVLIE
jgi:uncharacterized repeat protein (TIGR01451 family)